VAYEEHEGDMDLIYSTVMLSDVVKDDKRFRKIIDEAIESGDVPAFPAYTKETKETRRARVEAAAEEAKEAEEYAKELGVHDKLFGKKKSKKDSEADLAALIRRNQDNRGSFLDQLAEKYGAPKGKGKKKRAIDDDEPSEEAFQAAAARLKKPSAGEKSTSSKKSKR
jgi:DnaJ family protein C protein 9